MPVFSRPERPKKRRGVRWQDSFHESAANITSDVKRLDELTATCVWLIEEDAEACDPIPDTPFRVAKAQEVPGGPIMCVLFTIHPDDDMCDLWYVYETPDPATTIDP